MSACSDPRRSAGATDIGSPCPVCSTPLDSGGLDWHFICPACRYEAAALQPQINQDTAHAGLDEASRAIGLKDLRVANFRDLVARLKTFKERGSLLEIGCAHGWFLDEAQQLYSTCGIEPDQRILDSQVSTRHNVRQGYFPAALRADETFDVIVFNDVFEHLPEVRQAVAACRRHLNNEGLLLINLPSSTGVFYRLSKLLCRLALPSHFERMWQKGLPSPHLHYFNRRNLQALLATGKFSVRADGTLRSVRLKGLYRRISYASKRGMVQNALTCVIVAVMALFLPLLPSDIIYLIAQKEAES